MNEIKSKGLAGTTSEELNRHFDKLEDELHAEHHADPCNCRRCRDVIEGGS